MPEEANLPREEQAPAQNAAELISQTVDHFKQLDQPPSAKQVLRFLQGQGAKKFGLKNSIVGQDATNPDRTYIFIQEAVTTPATPAIPQFQYYQISITPKEGVKTGPLLSQADFRQTNLANRTLHQLK